MNAKTPVIAVLDVGKTNKKVLLYDQHYRLVHVESRQLEETKDEDGFPCEDVEALTEWVKESFRRLLLQPEFDIRAVNISAYGASLVYLDDALKVIPPLCNYLKPYPPEIKDRFYTEYGDEIAMARRTASPVLGNLNSGMQLYRMKYEQPDTFERIRWALHLPQYLSFILSSRIYSDITSIGSHTQLWDFSKNSYHSWVIQEDIDQKLPPVLDCSGVSGLANAKIPVGVGLHDSSAALIPYLSSFPEPFILLSTGTWSISMNPFNHTGLTEAELRQDCLCYLSYEGKPIKSSRLFAGHEHERQTVRLASFFNKPGNYFETVACDTGLLRRIEDRRISGETNKGRSPDGKAMFGERNLEEFQNYEEAYHQLVADIVDQQVRSTRLVQSKGVKKIFVDGGFSRNPIYMYLLAESFPSLDVYAASIPQASALGAALAIHRHWNPQSLPSDLIDLQRYPAVYDTVLKNSRDEMGI